MVSLGEKAPAWGLNRWGGSGLRFVPPDNEGFTLRGDRRRLVYKGRRRSHRFTILGDTAFEYDCILEKEPESNVISLLMEGAEKFDFFRQPDFIKDPLLAGSYAVYKKETIIGDGRMSEGTGKLCHIHRPQIIDSRGRRCWGDLSIVGNRLCITIPENFLSEAKYPVVVDPTIGSSTAGAYHSFYYIHDEEYEEYLEGWYDEGASAAEIAAYLEDWTIMPSAYKDLLFNRWTNPEPLQGLCNVFFHAAKINYGAYNVFAPVLFTGSQNIPDSRISSEEYGWLGTRGSSPLGWNTVTFRIQNAVGAESPLWLGLIASGIGISFDYGAACFDIMGSLNTVTAKANITNGQHMGDLLNKCGQYIPEYLDALEYGDEEWIEDLRPSIRYQKHNAHPKRAGRYDFKFSYYFQPVSIAYNRTLTAGVTLTDSRKLTGTYKRSATQTVKGTANLTRFAAFPRQCFETVCNTAVLKALPTFIRSVLEHVRAITEVYKGRGLSRNCTETVQAGSETKRFQGFYRKAQENVRGTDTAFFPVLFMRSLPETVELRDSKTQWAAYIRGLRIEAASRAETRHGGEYYRRQADTVQAAGMPFRSLLIFVRLLTTAFVRDFLLRRFLKSNEELVLKSPVCRELILDSTIH
jgi:hypothetical protein